jgi:hypothetical protein
MECPVCLEPMTEGIVSECGHAVCLPCARRLGQSPCVLCRDHRAAYWQAMAACQRCGSSMLELAGLWDGKWYMRCHSRLHRGRRFRFATMMRCPPHNG